MSETTALWLAADALTKPTTMRIHRDENEADLAASLLHDLATNPTRLRCSVAEYRAASEQRAAQSRSYGTIPSLWDQAQDAIAGQGDSDEGGGVLSRERSVADLALMETLLTVRELLIAELKDHGATPRATVPEQIRQVASLVAAGNDDESIDWWAHRLDQYARIIGNQINAIDNGPKPIRLRDSPCPECGARQVRVKEQDEWRMVPPLRIDFRHGMVRAAQCSACAHAWMRGEALEALADTLGRGLIAERSESA